MGPEADPVKSCYSYYLAGSVILVQLMFVWVLVAPVAAMILCAESQDSSPSASMRGVHVVWRRLHVNE